MSEMTATTELSVSLLNQLKKAPFVLLHTADAQTGLPTSHALSWIVPVHSTKLRFALDARSELNTNLQARPEAGITMFAQGSLSTAYGYTRHLSDALAGVPLEVACYELDITELKDAMFHGGRLCSLPEFELTYDKHAADKLNGQVFAAMKKA